MLMHIPMCTLSIFRKMGRWEIFEAVNVPDIVPNSLEITYFAATSALEVTSPSILRHKLPSLQTFPIRT